MSDSPLTSTQAARDQETHIDRVKWIRCVPACIYTSQPPPASPPPLLLSLSGEPPFASCYRQAPELEVAREVKRKAFLLMGEGGKRNLPHTKYREEGATNAIPSSARWGGTTGTVCWQIIMIFCLLIWQHTFPGERMPHVKTYEPGDSASITQGSPIEEAAAQCHLECCCFGVATTQEHKSNEQ